MQGIQLQKALLGVIAYARVLKHYGMESEFFSYSKDMLLRCGLRFIEAWEAYKGKSVSFDGEEDVEVMEELEKVLSWLMITRYNYKFKSVYRVIDKFYQASLKERQSKERSVYSDEDVKEFITEYRNYVAGRWGEEVFNRFSNASDRDVRVAAKVIKKVAKDFGLSVAQVIKAQHECYSCIQTPFVISALKNEAKVRERLERWLIKRKGEVISSDTSGQATEGNFRLSISNDPSVLYVKKRWMEVVNTIGIIRFLQIARGGFFVSLCKQILQEAREQGGEVYDRSLLKKVLEKYTPDVVAELWLKSGKPVIAY